MPKNAKIFYCEVCDFKCSKQSNYNKHLSTRKHQILINPNKKMPDDNTVLHSCSCGKIYKHLSSLCAHKKICDYENNNISTTRKVDNNNEDNDLKDVIMIMMNENKELRNILMDQQFTLMEI